MWNLHGRSRRLALPAGQFGVDVNAVIRPTRARVSFGHNYGLLSRCALAGGPSE